MKSWMLRPLALTWLAAALIAGCGGGAERQPTAAALAFAARAGHQPQVVDRDLRVLTRRSALAVGDAVTVRRAASELFDLGEQRFPQYFPGHQPDQSAGPFAYRHYPATGAYLVVDQNALQVYVLGGPFGEAVTMVGGVIDYVPCVPVSSGFPEGGFDSTGGDGDGDGPGTDGGVGSTSADGAIRGADVRLFDGNGALVGQAVSDDRGTARLKACGFHRGPYRVEYRGNDNAYYFDESIEKGDGVAGDWRPFSASESLEVFVPDLTQHVTVSPLTHAAVQMLESTGAYGTGRRPLDASRPADGTGRARTLATIDRVRAANQKVRDLINQQFQGTGLAVADITRPPSLAYSPAALQALGNNDRGRYAQILVALARAAAKFNPSLEAPAREMSKQLSRDLGDGVLDGKDRDGAAVTTPGSQAYDVQSFSTSVTAQSVGRLNTRVSGHGGIALNPPGQPCPGGGTGSCYAWGSQVTLTAQPGSSGRFESWGGACAGTTGRTCVLVMSGDKSVVATFTGSAGPTFGLNVGKTGKGTISSTPAGIACGSTCVASFNSGQSVTLTATAASGSIFAGWDGACGGTSPTCSLTMDGAKSVTAHFSNTTFTLGGTISGLTEPGLRLSNGDNTVSPPPGATTFQFPGFLSNGSAYNVAIAAQPTGQTCTLSRGSGVIVGESVTNVTISCSGAARYTVGGSIVGLTRAGLQLSLGAETITPAAGATAFVFAQKFGPGASYAVVVAAQPTGQSCSASNGTGVIGQASVSNVVINCADVTVGGKFTVGGTIIGLEKSGLQLSLGAQSVSPPIGATSFTFPTALPDGSLYAVEVAQSPGGQYCTVRANGSGIVAGAPVTNVEIECMYFVRAVISGLNAWGLELEWFNPNYGSPANWGIISPNDSGFGYGNYRSGDNYAVSVTSQPTGQTCSVIGGGGTISGADVDVDIVCSGTPSAYQVGGIVTSPTALLPGGLDLTLNGSSTQTLSSRGLFYFPDLLCDGCFYDVTVSVQPSGYFCTVNNGSGSISAAPVSGITVDCVPSGFAAAQGDRRRPARVSNTDAAARNARGGVVEARRQGASPATATRSLAR